MCGVCERRSKIAGWRTMRRRLLEKMRKFSEEFTPAYSFLIIGLRVFTCGS